jgi:hypothetical protein
MVMYIEIPDIGKNKLRYFPVSGIVRDLILIIPEAFVIGRKVRTQSDASWTGGGDGLLLNPFKDVVRSEAA